MKTIFTLLIILLHLNSLAQRHIDLKMEAAHKLRKQLDSIDESDKRNNHLYGLLRDSTLKEKESKSKAYIVNSDYSIKCIGSSKYKCINKQSSITRLSPISLCFSNKNVAFYCKEVGVITFPVERGDDSAIINTDSSYEFIYISAETALVPFSTYVLTVQRKPKSNEITAIFSFARKGISYIFKSKGFTLNCELSKYFN